MSDDFSQSSNGDDNQPLAIAEAPTSTWDASLLGGGAPPIRLPIFEGPLDLLLYLIRKNEIDIYDIPIEQVTRQYLQIIHAMERLELEIVGDFLVMAASLMEIKSRMLLPRPEIIGEEDDSEEGEDPRWELVSQLLEYRQFKEAAHQLESTYLEQQSYFPRVIRQQDNPLEEERPLRSIDRIEVWNVFNQVLRRLAESIVVGEISDDSVTVSDRMEDILTELQRRPSFRFSELFDSASPPTLVMLVATFLALLELARLNQLDLQQDEAFSDILCVRNTPDPVVAP